MRKAMLLRTRKIVRVCEEPVPLSTRGYVARRSRGRTLERDPTARETPRNPIVRIGFWNDNVTSKGVGTMNWDQIEGKWDRAKGKLREKWGKLTNDDVDVIAGKRDQLIGRLKERYGYQREAAEKEINNWLHDLRL